MSNSKTKSDKQKKIHNTNPKKYYFNSEESKREVNRLSNYINLKENELYICNNKKALICYQELMNNQKI